MKRVLYITNVMVPYRVRFFNQLAHHCDLTVLYERKFSVVRNAAWAESEATAYRIRSLNGISVGKEQSFSLGILKYILADYDEIIIGCYNSPVQVFAIMVARLLKIRYIINLDGETFLDGNNLKQRLKRFVLKGAACYLTGGEKSAQSLKAHGFKPVYPYYFSSLSESEIVSNAQAPIHRGNNVLVVGQYLPCKGLDIIVSAAKIDASIQYKIVGTAGRTEKFISDFAIDDLPNVRVIPFMDKESLNEEYRRCRMFVLPSRQECWGLVINEAASFGTPIVSTWGSGAAVEFLADNYPQRLVQPGDAEALLAAIQRLMNDYNIEEYSRYLINKTAKYSIENSVEKHLMALNIERGKNLGTMSGNNSCSYL